MITCEDALAVLWQLEKDHAIAELSVRDNQHPALIAHADVRLTHVHAWQTRAISMASR